MNLSINILLLEWAQTKTKSNHRILYFQKVTNIIHIFILNKNIILHRFYGHKLILITILLISLNVHFSSKMLK